jgi:histidine kinase 2/3/4 (cytokinin receptor)
MWRHLLPLSWVVGWAFASLWIFFAMNSQVVEKRRELLVSMCDERASLLEDQFNFSMRHVHALAVLVSTFHHSKSPSAMDQVPFHTFSCLTRLSSMVNSLSTGNTVCR